MHYFETLPLFFAHLGVALVLVATFVAVYVNVTIHPELKLIERGNTAVAIQMIGTILGFAIPLAMVIGNSVNLVDVILWGIIALVVQMITFKFIATLFKNIENKLTDDCVASGVFVGGIGLVVGIIQAGCMVP